MTRLLVLGGTGFVGRVVVEEAVARGWEVTAFHRGNRPTPEGAATVVGDRTVGLDPLGDAAFDLVVDTWAAAPRVVRDAARALVDRVGAYGYVSSRSVYRWPPPAGAAEDAPTHDGDPDAGDEVEYPQAKAGGERAVLDAFGADRSLLLRAGLILGPHEDVGRLPWWLDRIARGGDVLAPGSPDAPIQYVDVRDLAVFCLDGLVGGVRGAVNVVSPPGHATMGDLLGAAVAATRSDATLRWVEDQVIVDAGVAPWTELPVWLPPGEGADAMHRGDVTRAVEAGLRCRPVQDTVADTWAWMCHPGTTIRQRPDRPPVGLDADREAQMLRNAGF